MRNAKGQVLVETAIVLPVLILMLLGIIDFGRAMYTKSTLNNAARACARAAAVTPSPLALPEALSPLASSTTNLGTVLKNNLSNGVPADKLSYRVERIDATNAPVPGTAVNGDEVRVTVLWQNFPMLTALKLNLDGRASMRYER